MRWSLKIATIAGIGIHVHWTFVLVILWIFAAYFRKNDDAWQALVGVGFILTIFGCVILHELGHALMARRFGIATRDITLLPIGGVARLERIPKEPRQELLVALAGPLVNVVIAAALFTGMAIVEGVASLTHVQLTGGSFLVNVLLVNLWLFLFNLLPAFPMDGGRVLRALLVPSQGYLRATETAASVGQIMAIGFGLLAYYNPMLLFIALFVFLGAQQEAHSAQIGALVFGVPVREAMMTRFRTLDPQDRLDAAASEILAGDQRDFPVMHADRLAGMLLRSDLMAALGEGRGEARVADVMRRDCPAVEETVMLESVMAQMQGTDIGTLPVMSGERLIGLVSLENIGEWLMIKSACAPRGNARAIGDLQKSDESTEPPPALRP